MLSSICGSCCKKKSNNDMRRSSVAEAEERLQALKEFESKRQEVVPPSKYIPITFIPDMIVREIQKDNIKAIPCQIHYEAVLLIADVCGFTSLTETYCEKGVSGIEELASVLNGYMSTLAAMLIASDGDILNFAGDAFLVSWILNSEEDKLQIIEKAFNCALALQTHESLQTKNLDGQLRVKIGIGIGNISTWILGNPADFLMFVVSGPGLIPAHTAEEMCEAGDIIVTTEVCQALESLDTVTFQTTVMEEGFIKVHGYFPSEGPEPYPCRTDFMQQCGDEEITKAKLFSIPIIRDVSRVNELHYLSELTTVTILFVAMLEIEIEEPQLLDKTFDIVLECTKKQGGVLNKMLLFDKGCTYLVVFGLPGNKHANDAARGLLCANDILEKHTEINVDVSIGVTSGMCFCGIVGHAQRQEYTVIGNRVNLAARIMSEYQEYHIALDNTTFHMSVDALEESNFVQLASRKLKGIEDAGQIYTYVISDKRSTKPLTEERSALQVVGAESFRCVLGSRKQSIEDCLDILCDKKQRTDALSSKLLPVLIVEGPTGCGKNYYLYYAVERAIQMGYKTLACCTIPSYNQDPLATAALIVKHMLGLQPTDTVTQRQQKILDALPGANDPQLYLLNHLFAVRFPPPKFVNVDKEFRIRESIRLFKTMFQQYSRDHPLLLSIDNADAMDPWSWDLFHHMCRVELFVLLLSARLDFRHPCVSASLLLLKAHTHVRTEVEETEDFAEIMCWLMGVKAVHKGIYHFLRDETGNNVQLLKEVLLSPALSKYMDLTPFQNMEEKDNFYICQFPLPQENAENVYMCNVKEGSNIKNMKIPSNINDAVKETLNFLSNQDRLLLKRAALLGEDFDLHVLSAVNPECKCEEVSASLKSLIQLGIFSSVCTSEVILDSSAAGEQSTQVLECHEVCYCTCVKAGTAFRNYGEAHLIAGPYHRLKFRTDEFRLRILSYMTQEQFRSMHMEIVQELESRGLLCVSCRMRQMKRIQTESAAHNERLGSIHMDIAQCACLIKRPKVFSLIGYIWQRLGDKLLPPYFAKKAAQAANDVGYPVQALNYTHAAEELIPEKLKNYLTKDYRDFDLNVLKASVKKEQARSSLLLGNAYKAAAFVQKAFLILDLDTVHLYGVYSSKQFKGVLQRFPLLQAEFITKIIGILARVYILAEKYELALMVLKMEFVALSYYPIDFLQILNFMISIYQCQNELKPQKHFKRIEENTLRICSGHLRQSGSAPSQVEVRCIATACNALVEMNLQKNRLSRAENLAEDALSILTSMEKETSLIYINLIEVHLHQNRGNECFVYLDRLESIMDDSMPLETYSLYMCALSNVLILKLADGSKEESDQCKIEKCNAFASSVTEDKLLLLNNDIALYVAVVMALWSFKVGEMDQWRDADRVFSRCYVSALRLREGWQAGYWGISGVFLLMRMRLRFDAEDGERTEETRAVVKEELLQMKKIIKTKYPVFNKNYKNLVKDIEFLEPMKMLDSIWKSNRSLEGRKLEV